MAASSVSGVGPGSADGSNKGSEHQTLGVRHLLGTRTVAAGTKTLASGTGTVTFPQSLLNSAASYAITVSAFNSTTVARVTSVTNDVNGNFASFALAGGTTDVVHYMIALIGVDG